MDFVKVFDQAVREIKREVNLKVLKVPELEQKVLDATSDEPWGPHGTTLSELSHATKKFAECQMVMNVLWTRLSERGSKWRHALTIIEYLIANGSERAVDDILDHYSKISVLSSFEYVEPNGKDAGINVRKKVETILGLINDKEKIKSVREKAASNRDKYVGLSSTGITYKSSSASFGSNYSSGERYGSFSGTREGDSYGDSYRDKEPVKSSPNYTGSQKSGSRIRKDVNRRNEDSYSPSSLKSNSKGNEDDFDDFDPRGSSSNGAANTNTGGVDLFAPNLLDDFINVPAAATHETNDSADPQVDLFADADFQSAIPSTETAAGSDVQGDVDLFAEQPAFTAAFPPQTGFIPPTSSGTSEANTSTSKNTTPEPFDPFGAIPINSFDGSDPFGAFNSNVGSSSIPPPTQSSVGNISTPNQKPQAASDFGGFVSSTVETTAKDPFDFSSSNLGKTPLADPKADASDFGAFVSHSEEAAKDPFDLSSSTSSGRTNQAPLAAPKSDTKKENFQVKSGIWADSLSRGLIDLNITGPKKVNLADVGIVGGLDDGSDDKALPSWTMGAGGSSLGMSGIPSSTQSGGIESLANYNKYQFGFK
uniref:ENTH domain-containing protein n=1 Tax=Oryza punctata TaxID=4537 RepID=A0A0E0KUQ3_ORYPU